MEERDIYEILKIILNSIKKESFTWRLEGSANLKIQGIDTPISDLDISTNDEGIRIFRKALKKYVIKDFLSRKINGLSLICNINGFEVEINSYGDRELDMFDKTKKIKWKGLEIPILPLEDAKRFYELINRERKVKLIEKYLNLSLHIKT